MSDDSLGGWRRAFRVPRPADRQAREDVDAEITFHLEMRAEELIAGGLDPDEARARAEREFGDAGAARAELVPPARRRERRARRSVALDELGGDVRYGLRGLRGSPVFAIVAILTLGLAVGANTSIFSVANAVLFRPLPYAEPDRLAAVWETRAGGGQRNTISTATFVDWRNEQTSFEAFGAYSWVQGLAFAGDGEAEEVRAVQMSRDAFLALGVSPRLGRLFTPEEAAPGGPRAVILSRGFWQRRFGGDESVEGRTLDLADVPHTVVGVMGRGFDFPHDGIDLWPALPLPATSDGTSRRTHRWRVVARLRPGVSPASADAELDAISGRLEATFPEDMEGWRANVEPFRDSVTRSVKPLLRVLLGVVAVVLLVACANLANLLLARQTARARELAVRQALGAGRGRLVRQLLVESGIVAFAGAMLGVFVGYAAMRGFVALAPEEIPLLDQVRLDGGVLGFALGITVAALALFGVLPALRASAADPAEALAEGGVRTAGGRSQRRLRSGILVAQMALSVVLLVGAGLLTRSLIRLQRVDYGFEPEGLLAVSTELPSARYGDRESQNGFYEPLIERVGGLPGVRSVAATTEPPVVGYQMTWSYAVEGRPTERADGLFDARDVRMVTPAYFETLRMRLVEGRELRDSDRADAPLVAVVSERFAAETWPDEEAIGQRISFDGHEGPWHEVVGVVNDVRHRDPRETDAAAYVPWVQRQWDWMSWLTLMVRTDGDPRALVRPIEAAVRELDDRVPVRLATPVVDLYADSRARSRFATMLLVSFAGLAVALGAIGLYGVLAYGVSQRRREIGVRMALGAGSEQIAGQVVREGLILCGIGLAIGLALSLPLARFVESLLYGVGARDPVTLVAIPLVLLAVGAVAAWIPARRAARTDPASVLREA